MPAIAAGDGEPHSGLLYTSTTTGSHPPLVSSPHRGSSPSSSSSSPDPSVPHVPYDAATTTGTSSFLNTQGPFYDRGFPPTAYSLHPHISTQPAMFNYFAYPPHGAHAAWTNMPMIQHNPYPPAPPPPPPLLHKVWIIDCKTCGTFLTNRGMKAVLLLRPNVSLYSTDALPVNCAAYTTNPEALKPPPCRPLQAPLFPPRTCECLTQTLCCTTCGTPVGYMIVTPCARCTSSITATNRATNGHRFVFHSSEVTPSERHHVPGEPGVIPVDAPLPSSALPPPPPPPPPPVPSSSPPPGMSHGAYRPYGYSSARGESPPPLEPADPARYRLVRVQGVSPPQSPPPLSSTTATNGNAATGSGAMRRGSLQSSGSGSGSGSGSDSGHPTAQQPEQPRGVPGEQRDAPLVKLRAGDVLYWHHLVKTGEIPGVHEDKRARRPAPVVGAGAARRAPMHFDR